MKVKITGKPDPVTSLLERTRGMRLPISRRLELNRPRIEETFTIKIHDSRKNVFTDRMSRTSPTTLMCLI